MKHLLPIAAILTSAAALFRPAPAPQIDRRDVIEFLSRIEMVDLPLDDQGNTARAVRINGINVQIVNGTDEDTGYGNGVGNLILGYNGLNTHYRPTQRYGSHNLVLGYANNYQSAANGGIVAGEYNEIHALQSSVLGGWNNRALAAGSVVCGGNQNETDGAAAGGVVGGGQSRTVSGLYDWAAGSLFEDQ